MKALVILQKFYGLVIILLGQTHLLKLITLKVVVVRVTDIQYRGHTETQQL